MRAYRLTAERKGAGGEGLETHVRYHANQTEASEHKKSLRGEGWKPGELTVDQIEIPTSKAELIGWINDHCST